MWIYKLAEHWTRHGFQMMYTHSFESRDDLKTMFDFSLYDETRKSKAITDNSKSKLGKPKKLLFLQINELWNFNKHAVSR